MISGFFAGLSGLLLAGRTDSGFPNAGIGIELDAIAAVIICLLYTSEAADDLLCVDLGGRRIIKKK